MVVSSGQTNVLCRYQRPIKIVKSFQNYYSFHIGKCSLDFPKKASISNMILTYTSMTFAHSILTNEDLFCGNSYEQLIK